MRSHKPWCAEPQERDMWLPGTRVCSGGRKPWSRDESSVVGNGQKRVAQQSSRCWANWPSSLLVGEASLSYVDQLVSKVQVGRRKRLDSLPRSWHQCYDLKCGLRKSDSRCHHATGLTWKVFFIGGRDEKRGRGGRDWPLNTGALEREVAG